MHMQAQPLIDTTHSQANGKLPLISIIIPVYNDAVRLRECLQALTNQTYPKELFEVIVVDNGSEESISGITDEFPFARVIYESKDSSYAARNKGVAAARGHVIAFTDADCIPSSQWLENGYKALSSVPGCGFVGGAIEVFYHNPNKPTWAEAWERVFGFPQQLVIEVARGVMTANAFTFREVVQKTGPFDERLRSLGDMDWAGKVLEAGYTGVFSADAMVRHPARRTVRDILRRERRFAGGCYSLYKGCARLSRMFVWFKFCTFYVVGDQTEVWKSLASAKIDKLTRWRVKLIGVLVSTVRFGELVRLSLGGQPGR
jgi:glycosyltransferase involved in cell wall biosynthesis